MSDEIYDQIKLYSESEYPDNFSMQLDVIEKQVMAYLELEDIRYKKIPQYLATKIKKQARKMYPHNYEMQLYVIQEEIEEYVEN